MLRIMLALSTLGKFYAASELDEVDDMPVCDMGDPLFLEDGSVNGRCVYDGCSVGAQSCWWDQIDFCFDEKGQILEGCVLHDYKCKGAIECAWDLVACKGAWECIDQSGIGCSEGICIEPETTA